MTVRSIIIALLGAVFITAFGFFNDAHLGLEKFNSGQYLPLIVYGSLIVGLLTVNPLLHRIRRSLAFKPAELAVIVGMQLVVVGIPGRGLCEAFCNIMVMPAHTYRQRPGWQKNDIFKYIPSNVYPAEGKYDPQVQMGFIEAQAGEDEFFGRGFDVVPWKQWRAPLKTWMPLVLLMGGCSICMALVVHRPWSAHERLRYPIAQFADALIGRDEGGALGSIFKSRAFWMGFLILVVFRGANHLNYSWLDGAGVGIPWRFDLLPLWLKMTWFHPVGANAWYLTSWRIYPVVIAFSFFLASDISLSLGAGHFLYCVIVAILMHSGVNLTSDLVGDMSTWNRAGAYVGLTLMLLYIGRRYYWDVLTGALALWRRPAAYGSAVWACRFGLLGMAGVVILITRLGMPWPFSIITVMLILVTFIGASRIAAESGLFFIHTGWSAIGVMLGLFGAFALGPEAIFLVTLVTMMLCLDASMCLMPYVVHMLRICDGRARLTAGRMSAMAMGFYVIGVGIAITATLYVCYNFAAPKEWYGYFTNVHVPPLQSLNKAVTDLGLEGRLDESLALSPAQRLTKIEPARGFAWTAGAGLMLVLICAFMRLRFTWWPIHPVLFLVWGSWPGRAYWSPFLFGWFIKTVTVRYGGVSAHRQVKRFMIGVIGGEVVTGLIFIIIGFAYRWATGINLPQGIPVWPR